jgi:hypothetical protein
MSEPTVALSPAPASQPADNARGDPVATTPRTVLKVLLAIAVLLSLLSVAMRLLRWYALTEDTFAWRVAFLFDLNIEHNIPSYYSSILLLAAGVLLLCIATWARSRREPDVRYWTGLGAIFVFLSMDEMIELHEMLTNPLRYRFDLPGFLFYAWVIPYALFALTVALVYLRFLWRLPPRTRWLIIASGAIFVLGAIGMEVATAHLLTVTSDRRAYLLAEHLEEFLEMAGVSLFIYGLTDYIAPRYGGISLGLRGTDP